MFPQPYLSPTYWVTVRDPNTPTPCWQLSPEVLPCVLTHPPALLAQKCQTLLPGRQRQAFPDLMASLSPTGKVPEGASSKSLFQTKL